jgi:hypothetical protein
MEERSTNRWQHRLQREGPLARALRQPTSANSSQNRSRASSRIRQEIYADRDRKLDAARQQHQASMIFQRRLCLACWGITSVMRLATWEPSTAPRSALSSNDVFEHCTDALTKNQEVARRRSLTRPTQQFETGGASITGAPSGCPPLCHLHQGAARIWRAAMTNAGAISELAEPEGERGRVRLADAAAFWSC